MAMTSAVNNNSACTESRDGGHDPGDIGVELVQRGVKAPLRNSTMRGTPNTRPSAEINLRVEFLKTRLLLACL